MVTALGKRYDTVCCMLHHKNIIILMNIILKFCLIDGDRKCTVLYCILITTGTKTLKGKKTAKVWTSTEYGVRGSNALVALFVKKIRENEWHLESK